MATKINQILQKVPKNGIMMASWLSRQGMSSKELTLSVKNEWIKRLSQGVYYRVGDTPNLYTALYSYNQQLNKRCFVGALTALNLKGYYHYVQMGKPIAYLFTSKLQRLPSWLLDYDWDMQIKYYTTNIFGDNEIGIDILMASPERAFMECLYLASEYLNITDVK